MSENSTPLLMSTDWNEEWKSLQVKRRRADDPSYWNKRAEGFVTKDSPNAYVEDFLTRAAIMPGETVLDMGCGTGALSIPLGEQGHRVIAADFSEGMLDFLKEGLERHSLTSVKPQLLSWSDNWDEVGLTENSVDVALASRSIATSDLKDSLLRLDLVARRRVCVTMTTGSSPRLNERVVHDLNIKDFFGHDYQYALNILINEGMRPEVSYITSVRFESFDSVDEAYEDYSRVIEDIMTKFEESKKKDALRRLRTWLEEHLISNPDEGKPDKTGVSQKALKLDKPRANTWAFIAWNTQ